jgi:hypothetical protein
MDRVDVMTISHVCDELESYVSGYSHFTASKAF